MSLFAYYRIYEEWPDSWQRVVDEGLFQVPLRSEHSELIDPDDPSLDFDGDCYYDPAVRMDGKAIIRFRTGRKCDHIAILPPVTFAVMFPAMDAFIDYGLSDYLSQPQWLEFFAMRALIKEHLYLYKHMYGEFPEDITDFLCSGLGSIDTCSINPLTGDYYYFDGRPLNYRYRWIDGENYELLYADENGEIVRPRFGP